MHLPLYQLHLFLPAVTLPITAACLSHSLPDCLLARMWFVQCLCAPSAFPRRFAHPAITIFSSASESGHNLDSLCMFSHNPPSQGCNQPFQPVTSLVRHHMPFQAATRLFNLSPVFKNLLSATSGQCNIRFSENACYTSRTVFSARLNLSPSMCTYQLPLISSGFSC